MIKFGTGGFRGIIGDDFTKENVKKIAQGLANISKEEKNRKAILIGYDYRFMSDVAAKWIAEVLAANGIKVLLYTEAMPTPAILSSTVDRGLKYGVMITASHNPYFYNGVKLFADNQDADEVFTKRMEDIINQEIEVKSMRFEDALNQGLIKYFNDKRKYLKKIESFVTLNNNRKDIRILYDNLHGVGAKCIMPIYKKMGVSLKTLHIEHDTMFGGVDPNPKKDTILKLKDKVLNEEYDYLIGTDSDSDRLSIVDDKGEFISSNEIMASLYYYLVKYQGQKGDIVKNLATSLLLDKLAEKCGFKCHTVDVGFKNISLGIKEHDALLGGESSGGLTVRGYIFAKDSVFSSTLFLDMVLHMNKKVSEIVKEVKDFAGYDGAFIEGETRFIDRDKVYNYLVENTPKFSKKILKKEIIGANIKYIFEDGWALYRFSGTEAVCRVYTETLNKSEAEPLMKEVINYFDSIEK